MQTRTMAPWITLLCVGLLLAMATTAMAQNITLNLGHPFTERLTTLTSWEIWFAEEIEKRTKGKVKIKIFWSESLGKTGDLPDLVGSGGIDMSILVPGYYPARFPLAMSGNQLWFVNWTNEEAFEVAKTIYWQGPIPKELEKQNMKLIYVQVLPKYQLWSWQPINTIEELKGKKIRSWGPYMPRLYDAVGAVGMTLTQADWFEGMQKRMVDGAFFSVQMGLATKVDEVSKFITMVDLGVNTGPMLVMNLNRWNKLPDDVKQVFEQVMREMPDKGKALTIEYEEAAIKDAAKMGITMIEFPDRQKWIESLPDIRAQWKDDLAQKGLGKEAEEVIVLWDEALKRARSK